MSGQNVHTSRSNPPGGNGHHRPSITIPNQSVRQLDAGRVARQRVDQGRQPALGLLSKAAGGDRPPFIALTRRSGTLPASCQ